MKKVNLLLGCFKTYLIKRYLIKELEERIKKLNPIHLLAIKNELELEKIIPAYSSSEGFYFLEVKIYKDFFGNKYVSTDLGFVPIERHNAQVELMEMHIKYSNLLNDCGKLEGKFEKENELLENAQLKTSELNTLLGNLRNRVKILEKDNSELKKMELKILELDALIKILNSQVRTLKNENKELEILQKLEKNILKKENQKLQDSLQELKNKLVAETIKNTNLIIHQTKRK